MEKKKLILCFSILIVLLVPIIFFFLAVPYINVNGSKILTVNINSKYKDKGAKAVYQGKDISKEVKLEGVVNTKKEGKYVITYKVKKGIITTKSTRVIIVKDLEKPKITLKGGEEVFVCPNSTYEEEGYEVTDNSGEELTSKVKVKTTEDKIIYTVKDSEGNEEKKVRKITYKDKESPQIILKGGDSLTTYLNHEYKEQGYEVTDNCDKDLITNVKISGEVDVQKTGTYEIKYEVEDRAGNKATATRKINVIQVVKGGIIYLTFDDGPSESTTSAILDILKAENVKATFFVTNKGPDSLIKRMYDEGHTVALHTATHNYSEVYSSIDNYFNDLQIVHDRVKRITGYDAKYIRFPGGSSNTVSKKYSPGIMTTLTNEVQEKGYQYFDWNVDSDDAGKAKNANTVYNNVTKALSKKRSNVVLMHDIKPQSRDALKRIIEYGKNNGYTFAAIDDNTPKVHHGINN